MAAPTPKAMQRNPWVVRSDLRLAVVTGLSAGFGLLSDIPFGYYLPMTTAAVLASSYGSSLKLGIQRLLGSLMGVILLVIFSRSLQLPLALSLGLALGATRLLGGALNLQVGYKVAGNIIIMGWLVHNSEEIVWGPLRLFWTSLGIVISLWAARWIWPSRTIPQLHQQWASLLDFLAEELNLESHQLQQERPHRLSTAERRTRRTTLLNTINTIRQQRQTAQVELGTSPENHPLHRLWSQLDLLSSQLISTIDGLRGLPAPIQCPDDVRHLHSQEVRVLGKQITLLKALADEIRRPSLVNQQTMRQEVLKGTFHDLQIEANELEHSVLQTAETAQEQVSAQRLRQIVLRASLLGHMVMITRDNTPGLAGSTPVLAQALACEGSAGSGCLR
jgi:uncharacterized membrane protein YccC